MQIEKHYGRPMDIEWAKDGHTGELFIVQARPETVRSRGQVMERYTLHAQGQIVAEGRAIGHRIGAGPVKVIHDISEMNRIEPGDVLVTDMTDPDWEPIMKKGLGDRHQPRRPYLPRGDYCPRAGDPGGSGLR